MSTQATHNNHPALKDIRSAVTALEDKKAEKIRVLDVSSQSSITDFLVLATGTSEPHVKALKSALDATLKESGVELIGRTGSWAAVGWWWMRLILWCICRPRKCVNFTGWINYGKMPARLNYEGCGNEAAKSVSTKFRGCGFSRALIKFIK